MERRQPTLADYMVIAISPALIMAMIGSLVFYLIAVLQGGQYEARLCYVAALFVFAAVLIARIAMEEGRSYASIFSLFLGFAVWLVMKRFTEIWFPLDVGLIALVLWSADRLTWDCTLIDESEDPSNQGLLQTVGFGGDDDRSLNRKRADDQPDHENKPGIAANGEGLVTAAMNDPEAALREAKAKAKDWWSRRQRRPNKPGVWVVYFSLAALPLFGLGQWFIPAASGVRTYTFILLAIYLASGFGLLVTTSFLGLRLYLRRRNVEMPASMAGVWLGSGAAKIVVMLTIISMLTMLIWMLPRQKVESQLGKLFSSPEDIQPNRYGFGNDGPQDKDATREGKRKEQQQSNQQQSDPGEPKQTESDGNGGSQTKSENKQQNRGDESSNSSEKKQDGSKSQQESGKSEQSGDKGQNGSKSQESGKSESKAGSQQDSGKKSESQGGGKQQKSDSKQQGGGKKQQSNSNNHLENKQQNSASKKNQNDESSQSNEQQNSDTKQNQEREQANKQSESEKEQQDSSQQNENTSSQSKPPSQLLSKLTSWMGSLAKWIFYLVILIVLTAFLWFFRNEIRTAWARLVESLRNLWLLLFGQKRSVPPTADSIVKESGPPPKPFSSYPNPFTSGLANRSPPDELVNYSFEALEAWAREHQCARHPEQTPHEFAHQIGVKENSIGQASRVLADLYCRAAYAPGTLSPACLQQLQLFWQHLHHASTLNVAAL